MEIAQGGVGNGYFDANDSVFRHDPPDTYSLRSVVSGYIVLKPKTPFALVLGAVVDLVA